MHFYLTTYNFQFVYYRKPGSDDILVKILRNENEAKLPIATDVYPYYHWKDVRAYCLKVAADRSLVKVDDSTQNTNDVAKDIERNRKLTLINSNNNTKPKPE